MLRKANSAFEKYSFFWRKDVCLLICFDDRFLFTMCLRAVSFIAALAVFGAAVGEQQHSARYLGGAVCTSCHSEQADRWLGSYYDLAMQKADENSVLGDFDKASLTHVGVTSSFFK